MTRMLILGLLALGLLLAATPARADDPPAEASGASSPSAAVPPAEGATEGGARAADTTDTAVSTPYPDITLDQVQRAVRPAGYRGTASPLQGEVRLRYRFRSTTDEGSPTDNDVYGYLKLKYRDETAPGWSASFHGRLTLDLGEFGDHQGYYPFDSITDTYPHRINGRLYHLYANYRWASGFLEEVRIGRQYADVGEYILFDGVRGTTRPFGCHWVQFSAFAGVPAYLYDSTPDDGRFTAGGSVSAKPCRQTDLRLDYTFSRDDNDYYGRVDDHLLNFNIDQRIGMNTLVRATYQQLNADPRLARVVFDTWIPGPDVTIRGSWYSLLNFAAEAVYDFDYFYAVEKALEPYWTGNLAVSKGIGEYFVIEGGVNVRQVYKDQDEGLYNRNFEEYYASLSSQDWLLRDLELTLTGQYWNGDDDIWTATFDVDWRPNKCWRFRIGTDYSAYRYDLFSDAERQDVYGAFVRATWRPSSCWSFDLRLRVEDDDYGTWTTLDAGVAYSF